MSAPYLVNSLLQLPLTIMRLGFEAQSLIGLRLFRIATSGVPALASRMVPDKAAAVAQGQHRRGAEGSQGSANPASAKPVRQSLSRTKANKKRLSKTR